MKKDSSQYKTFGQRCKYKRLQKKYNVSEAARKIGCTPQYLAKVEKERPPKKEAGFTKISKFLYQIADVYECCPYWLLTGHRRFQTTVTYGEHERVFTDKEESPRIRVYAPIITWEEAASGINSSKDITDFETRRTTIIPPGASLNSFGLVMEGSSMDMGYAGIHNFANGDLLVFDPVRQPKVGDFVLARIKKEAAALFRQLLNDCGKLKLVPLNAKFNELDVDAHVEIIAVLCNRQTLF
jgi:SOS-response transcriptional repressor LexA